MTTVSLTCEAMITLLESLDENSIIGVDTEGTNIELDYRDGRGYGTGISIAVRFGGILCGYYPYRHPSDNLSGDEQARLNRCITTFPGWIAFHNAKHDLVALRTLGINYQGKFYCTLLMAHLLNEVLPYSKKLNGCVKYYLGEGKEKDDAVVKAYVAALGGEWHKVPANIMAPYAEHDAVLHLELAEKLEPLVFKEISREYWNERQKFIRCIIKMEGRGIRIDVPLCNRMAAIGEIQMAETNELLSYNLASPDDQYKLFIEDLGLPVIRRGKPSKKHPTGRPSFDKKVMEEYEEILEHRSNDSTAATVLTYRGWSKAVSSNYKPYVALLSPDGRLRCNYKLHGTKTGRSSCENPNLHQIPRSGEKPWNGKLKSAFIPMKGYSLVEADYAQLEFRLAAAYGHEHGLIEIFNDESRDLFTEMAKTLGETRFDTKTLTYAIQFGAGGAKIGRMLGRSEEEGKEIKDNWYRNYSGIKKVSARASSVCKSKGKVQLWSGRFRHFMYPKEESHKAFNSVIQGGATDIINKVTVRLGEEVDNDEECRMLLMIHDSIVFEIRDDVLEDYKKKIKYIMEDIQPDFGIKFRVDIHTFGE